MPAPVIVLEFNELSPTLMNRFISDGRLPGFATLRDESATYTTDAQESPPNLEPWIQWVTVHTGLSFAQHKIFDLNDAHKLYAPRIWDLVMDSGKKVWVCGSMNAAICSKKAAEHGYFIPDPWCTGASAMPAGMFDIFYSLTSRYVQEHTREGPPWSKRDYISFISYMLRHGLSLRTMRDVIAQLAREMGTKGFRWRRATLLDRFQWDLFRHTWKKLRPDFSTFFLNSTAHFQHYHWRELEPSLFSSRSELMSNEAKDAILVGYESMDRIVTECLQLAPQSTIVLATALSQQPLLRYESMGGKFIFKPVDHKVLMRFAGIEMEYQYSSVMAEEFKLYFDSEPAADKASRSLSALTVDGQPAMRVRRQGTEMICGCNIFSHPAPNALVRMGSRAESFASLFYQVGDMKSGGHHPDGIFWIRTPGGRCVDTPGKIPLPQVADMLAALVGVKFERKSPAPVGLEVAS